MKQFNNLTFITSNKFLKIFMHLQQQYLKKKTITTRKIQLQQKQIEMPKVVDNYILDKKIGAGQFGDVYLGYHQQTKQEVAIKTIRRETIKGKFYQLLQNQIKVLKTCDNKHIIKLFTIKKTANHFYLMLEYCNQGDMLALVRKSGCIPVEKVIKYLCQILHAFQDLVKYKIMHRDFKLANILLHEGNVKIADFGFAKLLSTEDWATTMLGSPLNMAPQVLGGNKYNSKADIWSIGACIWEMIYGKPPYIASNMVDLLNIIKTKPLKMPPTPILPQPLKDVIKKMLVMDSKKRISWQQLFAHPINTYLSQKLRKQINLELVEDESLVMNTSKFYVKNNLVVQGMDDMYQKQKMNEYLVKVIKQGKKKEEYIGQDTQTRQNTAATTQQKKAESSKKQVPSKQQTPQNKNQAKVQQHQPASSMQLAFRGNMKKIMHYRNIYVFLANVSDEILTPNIITANGLNGQKDQINLSQYKDKQIVAYFIIQKILKMIAWILGAIEVKNDKCGIQDIQSWQQFKKSPELAEIREYIQKQLQIFSAFNQSLEPTISKIPNASHPPELKSYLKSNPRALTEVDYKSMLKKYIKFMGKQIVEKMLLFKKMQQFRAALKHLEYCLIAWDCRKVFGQPGTQGVKQGFNFNEFYEKFNTRNIQQGLLIIEKMIKNMEN